MNAAIIRAIVEGISEGLNATLAAFAVRLDALVARLDSVPAGAPGVGIKSVAQAADHSTAEIELDNGQVIELQLPGGPKGEPGDPGQPGEGIKGDRGDDGQAPSADDVAAVLRASPDFIEAATPQQMQAEAWQPGIYRKGVAVSHYIGRVYCAEKDTTTEPGDSPDWRRLGTQGLRHVGGFADARVYEPGDMYAKSGSTFLFDGAKHRLLFQRPYTQADAEKSISALRAELLELLKASK
jgi:hypothetical protein